MNQHTGFKIKQLRVKNLVKGIESLSAFVAAVIANMLIPQLLIKYVYDPATLTATPLVFEYLPLVTYGLALLYFLYAMIGNFNREKLAKTMETKLFLSDDSDEEDEISEKELKELEKIVDEALKPNKKKTSKAKKTVKKKTAKKKTK